MFEWWGSLSGINQWFYIAAGFFSIFFLWQLISALIGLAGGELGGEVTSHVDISADHGAGDTTAEGDAEATVAVFKLLSIRSVLAFFTLFFWAAALYLNVGMQAERSLVYAVFWGLGAFVIVSLLLYAMRRLTETGTARLSSCVGAVGAVSIDIPLGGEGQIRVPVGGVLSNVKARGRDGCAIRPGTAVRVTRTLGPAIVEAEPTADAVREGDKK